MPTGHGSKNPVMADDALSNDKEGIEIKYKKE